MLKADRMDRSGRQQTVIYSEKELNFSPGMHFKYEPGDSFTAGAMLKNETKPAVLTLLPPKDKTPWVNSPNDHYRIYACMIEGHDNEGTWSDDLWRFTERDIELFVWGKKLVSRDLYIHES